MKLMFVSELVIEMRRQLVADMAAQMRLGEPFHSVKGCIKFEEPRLWSKCPISQVDFCLVKEWDRVVQIILWIGRHPDEDDFFTLVWPVAKWADIVADAAKLCVVRKEADDE